MINILRRRRYVGAWYMTQSYWITYHKTQRSCYWWCATLLSILVHIKGSAGYKLEVVILSARINYTNKELGHYCRYMCMVYMTPRVYLMTQSYWVTVLIITAGHTGIFKLGAIGSTYVERVQVVHGLTHCTVNCKNIQFWATERQRRERERHICTCSWIVWKVMPIWLS
jgi:hypothetical protein